MQTEQPHPQTTAGPRTATPIAGASGATYVAKAADHNKLISCKVTAKDIAGQVTKPAPAVKVT